MKWLINLLPAPQMPLMAGSGLALRWRFGWLRGLFYRAGWKLTGKRIDVGARFSVIGKLRVKGPGRITFGEDVLIDSHTDLYTHAFGAHLAIGKNTYLNGTRVGCALRIEIGESCILADARLMDTDFHAVSKNRHDRNETIHSGTITIENNVWVAAGAAVLRGVTIGRDSVVAFGSVVTKSVPAGKIVAGNPAREVSDVPDSV
jgi:acetyltransferase-like isoleucine patch superfamily enzyme